MSSNTAMRNTLNLCNKSRLGTARGYHHVRIMVGNPVQHPLAYLRLHSAIRMHASAVRHLVQAKTENLCWKCKKKIFSISFFCQHCNAIVPFPTECSYFDVFELPFAFDITIPKLQKKFKDLQRLLHPDKFHLKDHAEKKISEDASSLVNKAYFTLLSPLSRGIYMLEQNGIHIEEDESCESSDFLMKIMELNELIADADSIEILEEIRKEIQGILVDLIGNISFDFSKENLQDAKDNIKQYKYYNTLLEKLKMMIPPK